VREIAEGVHYLHSHAPVRTIIYFFVCFFFKKKFNFFLFQSQSIIVIWNRVMYWLLNNGNWK